MNIRQQQKIIDDCMIFSTGAVVYTAAEVLWRGYSHWTMTLTGGLCALLIHIANKRLSKKNMLIKCGIGGGIITAAEFAVGCIVNKLLGWNVWDYSGMPLNICGQVCLLYSIMWFFMSIPAIAISSLLNSSHRIKSEIFFNYKP